MPTNPTRALLTDIGTEELGHLEMVGTMFHMLVRDASPKDLQAAGLKHENETEPKSEPKIKPVAKPTPILPKVEIRPLLT